MLLPIVVSAVVGTVVGTFVTRWLNAKMPPPNLPPQQVVIVQPGKVNVGDFVLVDIRGGNLVAARDLTGMTDGTIRMRVTNIDPFGNGEFIEAQFADSRMPPLPNNSPIPVRRNGVVQKTT